MAGIDKQQARNRLVVCVFAAACAGFILAMALGAFHGRNVNDDIKDLPDWVANSIAIGSVFISAVAVYLVAETLRATRETLDATRIMAADQARIGDAQIRPWLLIHHSEVTTIGEELFLNLELKNYGNTPATNVAARSAIAELVLDDNGEYDTRDRKVLKDHRIFAVAPQTVFFVQHWISIYEMNYQEEAISIKLNYSSHDKKLKESMLILISLYLDEDNKVRIVYPITFG